MRRKMSSHSKELQSLVFKDGAAEWALWASRDRAGQDRQEASPDGYSHTVRRILHHFLLVALGHLFLLSKPEFAHL